jgi:hypothetical protein
VTRAAIIKRTRQQQEKDWEEAREGHGQGRRMTEIRQEDMDKAGEGHGQGRRRTWTRQEKDMDKAGE